MSQGVGDGIALCGFSLPVTKWGFNTATTAFTVFTVVTVVTIVTVITAFVFVCGVVVPGVVPSHGGGRHDVVVNHRKEPLEPLLMAQVIAPEKGFRFTGMGHLRSDRGRRERNRRERRINMREKQ